MEFIYLQREGHDVHRKRKKDVASVADLFHAIAQVWPDTRLAMTTALILDVHGGWHEIGDVHERAYMGRGALTCTEKYEFMNTRFRTPPPGHPNPRAYLADFVTDRRGSPWSRNFSSNGDIVNY